ncbi:hypothetical protein [Pseudomonas phage vB_PaeP_TUMS_P10]|nr:hypothetical protein [Pseudomonas phage vB_PaeS_TUMS_P6]UNI71954.1 hypothetical protein [Pseudomonas phage vB_PaeP_TUMS_P10]
MNSELDPVLLNSAFTRILSSKYTRERFNGKASYLSRKVSQRIWPNFDKKTWDRHMAIARTIV